MAKAHRAVKVPRSAQLPLVRRAAVFGGAYLAAADLSTLLQIEPGPFRCVWLPAGLYLAVLVISSRNEWPAFRSATPNILADPTQVYQVVMNLATNAVHAMKDHGGRLSVSLGSETLNGAAHRPPALANLPGRAGPASTPGSPRTCRGCE